MSIPYFNDPDPSSYMAGYDLYNHYSLEPYVNHKDDQYHIFQPDNTLLSDAAQISSDDSGSSSRSSLSPPTDNTTLPFPDLDEYRIPQEQSANSWDEFKARLGARVEANQAPTVSPTSLNPPPRISQQIRRLPPRPIPTYVEEESADEDDDDEYHPSLDATAGRKRRRGQSTSSVESVSMKKRKVVKLRIPASTSGSNSSASPAKATASSSSSTGRRARVATGSRNDQVEDHETRSKLLEKVHATASTVGIWRCPQCNWEQDNHRMPDFKRHLKTHLRKANEAEHGVGHYCHGVPAEKRHLYNSIPETAKPYMHKARQMVGGCMKSFSRRDALKRHLDNSNTTCVFYQC